MKMPKEMAQELLSMRPETQLMALTEILTEILEQRESLEKQLKGEQEKRYCNAWMSGCQNAAVACVEHMKTVVIVGKEEPT